MLHFVQADLAIEQRSQERGALALSVCFGEDQRLDARLIKLRLILVESRSLLASHRTGTASWTTLQRYGPLVLELSLQTQLWM